MRFAPLVAAEAEEMLASLTVDALLRGARGRPAGNRLKLIETVVAFSQLSFQLRDCIAELDVNPIIVTPENAVAVDALVVTQVDHTSPS